MIARTAKKRRLAIGALVAISCGVAALVALVVINNAGLVWSAIVRVGWGLAAIVAVRGVIIALTAAGWCRLVYRPTPRRIGLFMFLRWVRESIDVLLPVASVGGDLVAARLMTFWGVDGGLATASALVDLLVQAFAQFLFTVAGFGFLVASGRGGPIVQWLSIGFLIAALAIGGFYFAQRFGLFNLVERGVKAAARWSNAKFDGELHLDDNLQHIHGNKPAMLFSSILHLVAWFAGVAEVWIALTCMGAKPSFAEAMVLESIGQAIRDAAFPVPGALGIQEGGFIVIGHIYGLPAELALAVSLIKRVPDIVLGLPGLVAWHVTETRHLLSEPDTGSGSSSGSHSAAQPQSQTQPQTQTQTSSRQNFHEH